MGSYDFRVTNESTHLFVYGTLKRGDVRAPLLAQQRFIAEVRSADRYRLFNTGSYPALVDAERINLPGRSILGELWSVDRACLARLDEEEGVGEGLYARRTISLLGEAPMAQAYFYLLPVRGMADCGDAW
jgi:gamma-glutamylaminecyclotransferase